MLVKQALFIGQIKPGKEGAMRAYVAQTLAPLWQQFEGAKRVEVLFGHHQDPKGPDIPLALSISYETSSKMETAMASPARHKSRDLLPEFYETYWEDVRLVHTVFEVLDINTHES